MRYMISEKQLANLIVKKSEVDEQDETSISTASSSSSSSSDIGTSPGADEYPPYPEVKRWGQDGQTPKRGSANSIATQDKWGDHNQHPPAQAANSSF